MGCSQAGAPLFLNFICPSFPSLRFASQALIFVFVFPADYVPVL